ncbi:Uncharacterized protein OBRU01_25032, partial [Operophtera brumata]
PLFTLSRCGRPVLILGGYRYNKYIRCKGPKVRWNCGGRRPDFTISRFGKPVLLLGGYRYNQKMQCSGHKARWICSKYPGCKANVHTYKNQVIRMNNCHNHEISRHCKPRFTMSRYGKPVLLIGGHRFNKYYKCTGPKVRWYCTKISSYCKASIVTFTISRYGKPVLLLGGYRYNKNLQCGGLKARWTCSASDPKQGGTVLCSPKAVRRPEFTVSRNGKPVILLGGYRYNKYYKCTGPKARWVCCKTSVGCKASIVTFNNEIIQDSDSRCLDSESLCSRWEDTGTTNTSRALDPKCDGSAPDSLLAARLWSLPL